MHAHTQPQFARSDIYVHMHNHNNKYTQLNMPNPTCFHFRTDTYALLLLITQDDLTPLMFALREGKKPAAEMLIKAGANVHVENKVPLGGGCGVHGVTTCNALVHVNHAQTWTLTWLNKRSLPFA